MCLYINRYQSQNEKELNRWFGNRTKFAYVYKVLKKREYEPFYRSLNFSDFIWDFSKQKIFQVYGDPEPTEFELRQYRIDRGFHVYTNLEIAKSYRYIYNKIVKFRVKAEDIVAVGNIAREAVCTRLEFVKVIED